ncbi:hypothetical protein BDV25DRAFT_149462 [Aspergillus avenaceus]|uniref:Uncharacterized protein n=1 Tax=Aspergillus avenaceus TaxID=36643 RepID=A0A5N6U4T8_ASPAV|nr:hypothetical protein BDV25DRAFT_149462 [Aspergillus avenaceus]
MCHLISICPNSRAYRPLYSVPCSMGLRFVFPTQEVIGLSESTAGAFSRRATINTSLIWKRISMVTDLGKWLFPRSLRIIHAILAPDGETI